MKSTPPAVAPAPFQDLLASMAEVDRLKSREELLALEADLPARVADVTERLKKAYAAQGVAVPEHVIEQGVERFFSQRLVFAPPPPTLGSRLALLWIHRVRIFAVGAIASALLLAVASGVYYGVVLPDERARERERVAALRQVEDSAARLDSTARRGAEVFAQVKSHIDAVRHEAPEPELARAATAAETEIEAGHAAFDQKLRQARDALAPFSSADQLEAARTRPASDGAREALTLIESTASDLAQVSAAAERLDALRAERASLEGAWRRLDHPGLPAGIRASAEPLYARGLAEVSAFGQAVEVRQTTAKLHGLADAESALRALPAKLEAAAAEARAISHDPDANQQIASAERSGLAAVDSGDAAAAEKSLAELRRLTARLGEAYTLRIVNRPREYTRLWRHPNGRPDVKNFYVVVEAVSADGALVPLRIRSEEDGSTNTVTKWAERVDEATYESVGRDKKDDGVVQNDTFGKKEKGRLAPEYLQGTKTRGGDTESGRINRWEYRG